MTKKKDDKTTKASAVELEEKDLNEVQGGFTDLKIPTLDIKPRLTDNKLGVRYDGVRYDGVRYDGIKTTK